VTGDNSCWSKLYHVVNQGIVKLQGRPAAGPIREILDGGFGSRFECDGWDELVEVPLPRIKSISILTFYGLRDFGYLTNGRIYSSPDWPETAWVYRDIEVNFQQLTSCFHTEEAASFRYGTEVIVIRADSSAKRRGGRRPIYDWPSAFHWVKGSLSRGDIHPDREDLRKKLNEWFADRDLNPSDSLMRDKLNELEQDLGIHPATPET
jgi:hypothetical protein